MIAKYDKAFMLTASTLEQVSPVMTGLEHDVFRGVMCTLIDQWSVNHAKDPRVIADEICRLIYEACDSFGAPSKTEFKVVDCRDMSTDEFMSMLKSDMGGVE